jgi:CheY-like chemotaxis protein
MDVTVAALLVALVVVVVFAGALWRAQNHGSSAKASFSFATLFEASFEVGARDEARAEEALQEAGRQKGLPVGPVLGTHQGRALTMLARILWVDDHPDNNLFETVALENLGRFVTTATSTEAALYYLDELEFALAITDVGRGSDLRAGYDFIQRVRAAGRELPIVVYTVGATQQRERLVAAGAQAVVDLPGELIQAVEELLPHPAASARARAWPAPRPPSAR